MSSPAVIDHPVFTELARVKASMELIEAWLKDAQIGSRPRIKREIKCADVVSWIAFEWGIRPESFLRHNQEAKFVEPRWAAWYLARKLTDFSYPQIARFMGEFDHSTVIDAVRAIGKRRLSDVRLDARLKAIEERLA